MTTPLDDDAQPVNTAFNAARLNDRMIDELIGVCKGVLFDGAVTEAEAIAILEWMNANREVANHWPANVLYQRVGRAMADGQLCAEEERELLELLVEITGGPSLAPASINRSSTRLPIDVPAPPLQFNGFVYCFTGKFVSGGRRKVEQTVLDLGADVKSTPSKRTHYLVIGEIGSADWIHSTHGRKIEKAVSLRESGHPITIVAEQHWAETVSAL